MKVKVFTAFSGYDSQCMALERLKRDCVDFDYELVGWSEIEPNAIMAHNAVFPQYADRNYGDISKIDWDSVPDFDLFTYSSPCQDFSSAGNLKGGEEGSGTRSSLLWECQKAIKVKRPKYLLFENVPNLLSNAFMPTFRKWIATLDGLGYKSKYKILNSADYGVPQSRKRVFLASVRTDIKKVFYFPKPYPLVESMKDKLEDNVDISYYISQEKLALFIENCPQDLKDKYQLVARRTT